MELHTEAGSRSHFWTPISQARQNSSGVRITAKKSWVTSAGHAQSYVVSSLASEGSGLTDSTLYLIPAGTPGLSVTGLCDGLGLRANASAPPIESESQNLAPLQSQSQTLSLCQSDLLRSFWTSGVECFA